MVTVRLFLMGLVALVPSENPNKLMVVVPDVQTLTQHKHVAVFAWDRRNHDKVGEAVEIATQLNVDGGFGGHLLKGHVITIDPMTADDLRFEGGVSNGPSRRRMTAAMPEIDSAHAVSWIPSMKTLTGGEGSLGKAYVGNDAAVVAARLSLSEKGGRVMTFSFADDGLQVPAMRFVGLGWTPVRTCRQAVADVAVIEMTYREDELPKGVVVFAGHGYGAAPGWQVELTPYLENGQKRIDVLVGNLTPMGGPVKARAPEATLHFDLYNGMLAHPPSYRDRLLPVVGGAAMRADGVDPSYCNLPPLLQAVSRGPCEKGLPPKAGIARPICMLATFEPPD